jgi:HTH-like domain
MPAGRSVEWDATVRAAARVDEDALNGAIVALAGKYGRYGYRRVIALLNQDGWQVGKDRVQRIWRRERLKVPGNYGRAGVCGSMTDRVSGSGCNGPITCGATTSSPG